MNIVPFASQFFNAYHQPPWNSILGNLKTGVTLNTTMAYTEAATQWHAGEEEMHRMLRVPQMDNPTQPYLSPHAASILTSSPLIALGTLDSEGRPWTTLWGGEPSFSRPIAPSIIGLRTTVDRLHDPVLQTLLGDKADGEVVQVQGVGKMVGGLAINLQTRRRVKLYGRMVAGALAATEEGVGEVQLVVKIEQSLGRVAVLHTIRPRILTLFQEIAPSTSTRSKLFLISPNLGLFQAAYHYPHLLLISSRRPTYFSFLHQTTSRIWIPTTEVARLALCGFYQMMKAGSQ
jgi:predicted pyridoxine 5'-phosphate oxidase superfamily flavin-nucleotide-binding protein